MSTSTPKKILAAAIAFAATILVPLAAFAEEPGDGAVGVNGVKQWATIGAGVAIGLAALGGALGQGRAGAAALEGISRNPGAASKIQTPMILALALIESLVLFALLIAYLLMAFSTK
jgi:F-type H+-transporting ATPase subunit c